ncbi:MAG: RNA polymerase sigma-54 factor [Candidatus Coatesbacteria bacterium]|nr:MAG: RNA polymerase sigma-54 factor [Candidatus Coatesbacteria bacterium]
MVDRAQKSEQKIKQKLKMAPRVLEYIKILRMPAQELRTYLRQSAEQNPFVDVSDESTEEDYPDETAPTSDYEPNRRVVMEAKIANRKPSLQSHLLNQLNLLVESEEEKKIGEILIGEIDERGLFTASVTELSKWYGIEESKLRDVLKRVIQRMEPTGVGAESVEEAIEIQLREAGFRIKNLKQLVKTYIKNPGIEYTDISKRYKLTEEKFEEFKILIRNARPYPAEGMDDIERVGEWELEAVPANGGLKVRLNPRACPNLIVKREYYNTIMNSEGVTKDDLRFIRGLFRQAKDMRWTVNRRLETVLEVSQAVLDAQPRFLKEGLKGIRPLKMEDIADKLGTSISTISRAVSSKYIKTPHGILPMKIFFTKKVRDKSQREILEAIKEIIADEDPRNPLSDEEILAKLKADGYDIARRTVAKYRDMLNIPSLWKRKRLSGVVRRNKRI